MWPNDRGPHGSPWAALACTPLHVAENARAQAVTELAPPEPGTAVREADVPLPRQVVVGAGGPDGHHHRQRDRRHAVAAASRNAVDEHDHHRRRQRARTSPCQSSSRACLVHGHLTGWDPGWYDGFPLYTFYFTIPDLFIAIGGWIIPYGVAFKLGTILGPVILPPCAWACGRFFRLREPLPTILAAATLPFLFDYTFTIYGGNLFPTLAGEYAYSFSLSLAVLFLGLFACAVGEGRYRGRTALVLAVCILSHMVGGLYALGGAAILTLVELLPARWGDRRLCAAPLRAPCRSRLSPAFCGGPVRPSPSGCCSQGGGWSPSGSSTGPRCSWGTRTWRAGPSTSGADAWALVLAGVGVLTAVVTRSRFGITVTPAGHCVRRSPPQWTRRAASTTCACCRCGSFRST